MTPPKPATHTPYRPEIDGLRALAVLAVILFHAGFPAFSGGYAGVDVFFVISGYLITQLLLADHAAGRMSLRTFYERRARRILPALFLVMAVSVPFAALWLMPEQLLGFFQSLVAVSLFASNFLFWHNSGYFEAAAELKPLLHTWSLSVEEQYYIVFPLILGVIWRYGQRRMVAALFGLLLLSFAASEIAWRNGYAMLNFYLTPFRAWELLIGSLTAALLFQRTAPRLPGAALLGLVMITASFVLYDKETPFPSVYALLPTLGAALVLAFARADCAAGRLLSLPPLRGIGLISYSAYLWHFPLFAFYKIRVSHMVSTPAAWLLIGACLALAYLSWRFVEQPFRDKTRVSRRGIAALSCAGIVLFAGIGLWGHVQRGFPETFAGRLSPEQAVRYSALQTAVRSPTFKDGACKFRGEGLTADFRAQFASCAKTHGQAVLILGDSHGMDLYNAMASVAARPFVVGISKGGCRPHTPHLDCPYEDAAAFIEANKASLAVVFYKQKGSYLLTEYRRLPLRLDLISLTEEYVARLAALAPTVWIGAQAEPGIDIGALNILFHDAAALDSGAENTGIAPLDAALLARSVGKPYRYVSLYSLVDYSFDRDFIVDGQYTHSDTDHWSTAGEQLFGARLLRDAGIADVLGR
ncbi:MAG: acyltransferase [Thalassospira sp.]|nr:acyltransferase [Thalassospira sp.]